MLNLFIQWLHSREKKHVTYRGAIGKEHNQAVYSYSQPSCRRHSVFESSYEIFVNDICFVVTCISSFHLMFESFALIYWIIQLRVCVCKFALSDKEFKSLNKIRSIRFSFCERRNFHGIIANEGRLN